MWSTKEVQSTIDTVRDLQDRNGVDLHGIDDQLEQVNQLLEEEGNKWCPKEWENYDG